MFHRNGGLQVLYSSASEESMSYLFIILLYFFIYLFIDFFLLSLTSIFVLLFHRKKIRFLCTGVINLYGIEARSASC